MTTEEMCRYLAENCTFTKYEIEKMLTTTDIISVKDLVEEFIETDKFLKADPQHHRSTPWNLQIILAHIGLIIPVEDGGR